MNENQRKKRVVLFTSYYRGVAILENLLSDRELMDKIEIIGVVTDIPGKNCRSDTRHWQHGYTQDEATMVETLAKQHGIPVYTGKVKTQEFYDILEKKWRPDVIYMGTFGQILDQRVLDASKEGVFNTHPYNGGDWPSPEYGGLNGFPGILKNHLTHCVLALHQVNDKIDDGPLVYCSLPVTVPYEEMQGMTPGKQVQHMQKVTAQAAVDLINTHLRSELGMALTPEQAVGYAAKVDAARQRSGAARRSV